MKHLVELYACDGEVSSAIAECPNFEIAKFIGKTLEENKTFEGREIDGQKYSWHVRIVRFSDGEVVWGQGV